jgi:hypothetical protein
MEHNFCAYFAGPKTILYKKIYLTISKVEMNPIAGQKKPQNTRDTNQLSCFQVKEVVAQCLQLKR